MELIIFAVGERTDTTYSKLGNWTTDLAPLMNGKIFSSFKESRSEPLSQWFLTFWGRQVVLHRFSAPPPQLHGQSIALVLVSPESVMPQLWMWDLGAPHLLYYTQRSAMWSHLAPWEPLLQMTPFAELPGVRSSKLCFGALRLTERDSDPFFYRKCWIFFFFFKF